MQASDPGTDNNFGLSVDIEENRIVAGASDTENPDRTSVLGGAYVFELEGGSWVEKTKLVSGLPVHTRFGWSVSLSGDTIAVGAYADDDACPLSNPDCDAGALYVFRKQGTSWIQEAKLLAGDADPLHLLGFSVAVDGDALIGGAIRDDSACPGDPDCRSGAAYVFRRSGTTWTEEQKLVASDAAQGDWFGLSVSIQGDVLVVGAPHRSDWLGSAFLFQKEKAIWTEKSKITASGGFPSDVYGWSVSLEGDRIAIGAFRVNNNGGEGADGSVYTYSVFNALNFDFTNYGDVDNDDDVDLFDLFCILRAFNDDFSVCSLEDMDLHPFCTGGDGTIDLFDLFALLNAFSAPPPCCTQE